MNRRLYQEEPLREFADSVNRMFALLWERQAGKSTTFADIALFDMMRNKWRTVIYGSASLLLGQEITLKQSLRIDQSARELVEKEAKVLAGCAERYTAEAAKAGLLFQTANAETDKLITEPLKPADFAELFENQKLEFRVYHDRGVYSRTKVIAPNVATARSWSGTVILDEIAFIRALRELIVALLPIISTNKDYKLIFGTTPPEFNDTHYSFELLAPPTGLEFKPSARGNWYESEGGVRVHRADAYDTHLAGKKIYDLKTGAEITPDEAFKKALNKDGHRIAHFLKWMLGGAAACDLQRLTTAQARGAGQCATFVIDTDADFVAGCNWLAEHIDPRRKVSLGLDKATTTKEKSNPSVLAVAEDHNPELLIRAFFIWKTKDPDVANARIEAVLNVIKGRKDGGHARALAIDATNERNDAETQRKKFRKHCPVHLVVGSEGITTEQKPGLEKPTNWKQWLGEIYVAKLDDNQLTLPPEQYIKQDHRLVMKDRGRFVCEPDNEGRHGDTFDAGKLALHALTYRGGDAVVSAAPVGSFEARTI